METCCSELSREWEGGKVNVKKPVKDFDCIQRGIVVPKRLCGVKQFSEFIF